MGKNFQKVVYRHEPNATDLFQVIVNGEEYRKWKAGDTTIPLTEVVDSFQVFHTGQGSQGIMGHASKQQLDNIFGTHKDADVVEIILQKGEMQQASVKDGFSTTNDTQQGHNTKSVGSGGGHGGR